MRTWCSSCGTPLDPTRQFCATCGVYTADGWAPPLDAKTCERCGAVNAPDRTDCGRCMTNLATGRDAYCGQVYLFEQANGVSDAPATPGLAIGEDGDPSACPSCGTVNRADVSFCGNCGRFLEWGSSPDGPVSPLPTPGEGAR